MNGLGVGPPAADAPPPMREPAIRAVLQRHVRQTRERGTAGFADLAQILRTHPTWAARFDEIEALRVTPRRDATLLKIRKNGRWFAVSWRACVVRTRRKRCDALPREIKQLYSAMRTAVRRQMAVWRNSPAARPKRCARCGKRGTRKAPMQVDHLAPSFMQIRDAFLAAETAPPPTRFGYGARAASAFLPDDVTFARRWQRFHQARASYQLLCKPCNASKGGRPPVAAAADDRRVGVGDGVAAVAGSVADDPAAVAAAPALDLPAGGAAGAVAEDTV